MSHPLVPPPYMLSSNQVLNQGRYRVINQFGNVESGSFYEAYDTFNETKVVLRETVGQLGKVATPAQIENLNISFAEDAKRLTEVEHPSLLKVRDYFSEIDRQYLVIEACDGSDLAELVEKSEEHLALADVLRWADQLLDGLGHLHSKTPAIIHQKVCPQNIRLTSNFKVKLLITGSDGSDAADSSEQSDAADQAYRALEQLWLSLDSASQKMIANSFGERSEEILRQESDARTDIYSTGATLYYLLTRTVPADPLNRYLEILDGNGDPLQKPSEIDPSIPTEVCEALMKALELKREYRFESAAAMHAELAKIKVPANSHLAETKKPDTQVVEAQKEESKLDEEVRFEKERTELEAEQKRLEEEQVKIEKRRLELEQKREADLLEAGRRHEERKKEEKLKAEKAAADQKAAMELAAKAENEKQLRLKTEAKEKAKVATRDKHEVEKLQQDLAKDDLLDLPEHISEPAFVPEVVADVFALDVESPARSTSIADDLSFDLYSETERKRSFIGRPVVLAGAAVMALVVGVGVWMFSGKATQAPSPAASIQNVASPAEPTTDAQSSVSAPVESTTNATPSTQQPAAESPNSQALTADAKTKADQLAKQKQLKQQAQQPKPAPEKKKAVTVDDLINDN